MAQNIAQQKELTALFAKYNIRIGMLYGKFIKQLSALGINVEQKLSEDALFLFDNFPELKARLNDIFRQYVREQMLLAQSGIQSGVGLAFGQDARTLKGYTVLNDEAIMQVRNLAASAFLAQRMNTQQGLNLSQRVWNYAEQTKSEFEMAMSNVITDGLQHGTSAAELSRRVRDQLQEPDMMYRRYHHKVITKGGAAKDVVKWHKRIIDEEGKVRFIEAPLEEVGQGVYRSSYRNTFRLMRTEINMSYHYANCERWANEPFVIGIRIWGSPQHPEPDICDELWGDYPKDFKFSGFHPQCLCAASAITASREEIREYHRRKRAGEDVSNFECKGTVKDVPQQYKDYLQQHREQIQRAGERGTLAYVFRDNPKYLRTIFDKEQLQDMGLQTRGRTPEEAKVWRHAQRDDAAAQKRWNEYQLKRAHKAIKNAGLNNSSPVLQKRLTALQNAISSGNKDAIKTAYADIWNGIRIQQLADARHAKRNDAAVQSTWNERRKQNALIFNTGRNVLAVADKLAFVDTSASAGLLRDLLLQYKLKEAANLTKTLAKQIAEVKKQAAKLQYVQDAQQHLKKVSLAELQSVEDAVAKKVVWVENKFPGDLLKQADKYNWEAYAYLGGNMNNVQDKYPDTWQISQAAYIKLIQQTKEKHEWQQLQKQYDVLVAYNAKSPKYWQEVLAVQNLLLAKTDIAATKAAVAVAEKHMKDLESQRKSYNKKKSKAATAAAGNAVSAKELTMLPTEAQIVVMAERLSRKRIDDADNGKITLSSSQYSDYLDMNDAAKAGNKAKVLQLLAKLGDDLTDTYGAARKDAAIWTKTPQEADDTYFDNAVQTYALSNAAEREAIRSYTRASGYITKYLRGIDGYLEQDYSYAQKADKHSKDMTAYIARSRMQNDIWLKRDERAAFCTYRWGLDVAELCDAEMRKHELKDRIADVDSRIAMLTSSDKALLAKLKADKTKYEKELKTLSSKTVMSLVGRVGTDESFMSCGSCRGTKFSGTGGDNKKGRPRVVLNIYCPAGTCTTYADPFNIYTNSNMSKPWDGHTKHACTGENEFFMQRGTTMRVTNAEYDYNEDILYLDVEVVSQLWRDFDVEYVSGEGYKAQFK